MILVAMTLGAIGLDSLVTFLIYLIVLGIVIYAVSLILNMIALPQPIKQLVWLVIAVIVLILLLSLFGIVH